GKASLEKIGSIISGYSNLEFNLNTGKRGQRNDHIKELLTYITGAENVVVVNNNAAAVFLTLLTFAKGKEVIVSRGELIEIGGSFRIPDIMKLSGAKMVEVGTTNRTRIKDYEEAITDKTRILFKAHKSNYEIKGFSEEVGIEELTELTKKYNLIMFYDIGSGLLRKPEGLKLKDEPDVLGSLNAGADLVSFSGDKLLGGPQAGIIAGKKELINKLAKSPLMRALRVGKLTMSALQHSISAYLDDSRLAEEIPIFEMLNRDSSDLKLLAEDLQSELSKLGIRSEVVSSKAQVGGGTLPGLEIESFGVQLSYEGKDRKFAQKLFRKLLDLEDPVLGILREGKLIFDVLSVFKEDISELAARVAKVMDIEK
ncbi:L-seryl-tRNA(Sec) selenium transferase, partial [Candidatus Cloacimonadota bacterium]